MENIIYLHYYSVDNDPDSLNIIFSLSSVDIDVLKNTNNNILSYTCNNYYQNNDKFIDIHSINFNEKYRTDLQNFIKSNGEIIIVDKVNINTVDNKKILYDLTGVNGSKMDLVRQMKLQC